MHRICSIVVDCPDFLKAAALHRGFERIGELNMELVLAVRPGMDIEDVMEDACLRGLGLPRPSLQVDMDDGPVEEEADALARQFVESCGDSKPEMIVSIGDGVGGLAAAMAGGMLNVPVARIEAGLRSFDESSEAERSRRWCDSQASMHFASEPSGVENLEFEALGAGGAHLVGDLLLEALASCRPEIEKSDVLQKLELQRGGYAFVCYEGERALGDKESVARSIELCGVLARGRPVVLHMSRKTLHRLGASGDGDLVRQFRDGAAGLDGLVLVETLPFADYLALLGNSQVVLSDAEGVQSEAAFFDVPCFYCGENSARIFYEERGTTTLVRREPSMLDALLQDVDAGRVKRGTPAILELGTGVADKIAILVKARLGGAPCGSGCGGAGNCSC